MVGRHIALSVLSPLCTSDNLPCKRDFPGLDFGWFRDNCRRLWGLGCVVLQDFIGARWGTMLALRFRAWGAQSKQRVSVFVLGALYMLKGAVLCLLVVLQGLGGVNL